MPDKKSAKASRKAVDKRLLEAIQSGEIEALRSCLAEGADPNAKRGKTTALELAGRNEPTRCALIEAGAWSPTLRTSLPWAASTGRPETVKALLDKGAEVDARAPIGTALHVAAKNGFETIARGLIEVGASVDLGNSFSTPLIAAIENGQNALIKLLINSGANPNAGPSPTAPSPLQRAVSKGDCAAVEALITAGADLEAAAGEIPLSQKSLDDIGSAEILQDPKLFEQLMNPERAVESPSLVLAARLGHAEIVKGLLGAGANPISKDGEGQSAWDWASQNHQNRVIEVLQSVGLGPIASSSLESLLSAAASGDRGAIENSLRNGVSIDGRDERKQTRGWTALMHAAAAGHLSAIEALLSAGADPKVRSSDQADPILKMVFSSGGLSAVTSTQLDLGRTALHRACEQGSEQVVQALLGAGSDPNTTDHLGFDALMIAAISGSDPLIPALVDADAQPKARGPRRETALMMAAEAGSRAAVAALADRGAKVDLKDSDGMTPLMHAASRGDLAMARDLIQRGADPNKSSKAFGAPLHRAAGASVTQTTGLMTTQVPCPEEQILAMVELLLDAGADPKIKSEDGDTPAKLAKLFGHTKVAERLKKGSWLRKT